MKLAKLTPNKSSPKLNITQNKQLVYLVDRLHMPNLSLNLPKDSSFERLSHNIRQLVLCIVSVELLHLW